jgi:hypothetical protein
MPRVVASGRGVPDLTAHMAQRTVANTGYPVEEIKRRCVELARANGIGDTLVIRYVRPWSLKAKPEVKPEFEPATAPVDIEARIERTVRTVLATHYRFGTPWPRAWNAALLAVHKRKLASEADCRAHYLNGGVG